MTTEQYARAPPEIAMREAKVGPHGLGKYAQRHTLQNLIAAS